MVGLSNQELTEMAINLSALIKHNVNIFNVNGEIVGSSDLLRIGEYHSVAHGVIKGEIKEVAFYDTNREYVKPGINLPILSDGKVIGAVGITGDPNEVMIFSKILKMALESQIARKLEEDKRMSSRKYEKQVVLDILFDLSGFIDIEQRLRVMGYTKGEFNALIKFYEVDHNFRKLFESVNFLEANMNDKVTFIISSDDEKKIIDVIKEIKDNDLHCIVSDVVIFEKLSKQYKIINFVEQGVGKEPGLFMTKDHKLNAFFNQINISAYAEFPEALPIIENQVLVETFEAYIKNDLSLVRTSEDMYVHINTLKYRIKKIEELTDCSLKNVDDILKIKLSILSFSTKKD